MTAWSKALFAVVAIGGLLTLPLAVGLIAIVDAADRRPEWLKVASVENLAADGEPQSFVVQLTGRDAWSVREPTPVGMVYLRKTSAGEIVVLNMISPRLGSSVYYDKIHRQFKDACLIDSVGTFDLDGKRVGANISPRDLERIDVRVERGEVWIRWPNKAQTEHLTNDEHKEST